MVTSSPHKAVAEVSKIENYIARCLSIYLSSLFWDTLNVHQFTKCKLINQACCARFRAVLPAFLQKQSCKNKLFCDPSSKIAGCKLENELFFCETSSNFWKLKT